MKTFAMINVPLEHSTSHINASHVMTSAQHVTTTVDQYALRARQGKMPCIRSWMETLALTPVPLDSMETMRLAHVRCASFPVNHAQAVPPIAKHASLPSQSNLCRLISSSHH